MPRRCTVCVHPDRPAIDQALINHRPFRDIAGHFNVSKSAAVRHHDDHLPATLAKAKEAEDVRHAVDIVQQLKAVNGASLNVLSDARRAGDGLLVLKAVDRVVRQIELQARLLGELDDAPTINVFTSPDWQALERVITETLGAYPDARIALAARLAELSGPAKRPAMSRNDVLG